MEDANPKFFPKLSIHGDGKCSRKLQNLK